MPLLFNRLPTCWVLLLMMALLPLRGWAGTSMAIGMAVQQVAAAQAPQPDGMPTDCPMNAATSGSADSSPIDITSPTCSGCETCDLCLAMASFTHPQFSASPFIPGTAPRLVPQGYFSADHASPLKPPIS